MTPTTEADDHDDHDDHDDGRIPRRQFISSALLFGLSATGAAGALAACHPSKQPARPKTLSGRVQILVGFDGGNTAAQRQAQQALAQAFIAAHPQVGIDFLRATSAAAAETQLSALITRGSPPDVVLGIGLANIADTVDQHRWLDLRPLLQRDGLSTGVFSSDALAAVQLSSYYGGTKAIPGVPLGIHDHALAYNVALFSKAGISPPPTSWSDGSWKYSDSFLQAAQALTVDHAGKRANQAGFDPGQVVQFGVARISPAALFPSFGAHLYNRSKRRAQFDSAPAIQAAQYAGDLVNKHHVHPTSAQLAHLGGAAGPNDTGEVAWRAGKLAMIDLCSCEIDSPFGSKVPFAWKPGVLPSGPSGRVSALEVSAGAIVAASAQHDLAWEVLKFLAVDPAQEGPLAYNGFGAIPALKATAGTFTSGTMQSVGVDPAVWAAGLPNASAENDSWLPAFAEVQSLLATALARVMGGANAATAMGQLQQLAQAKIDAWFTTHKLPK